MFASFTKKLCVCSAQHKTMLFLLILTIAAVLNLTPGIAAAATACNMNDFSVSAGADCARGNGQPAELVGDGGIFNRITSILLFIVGAIAVIMLIFGGIRYIVSGGNQENVTAAKNTILYAIIGIVIALLAYAAVKFVTTTLLTGMT